MTELAENPHFVTNLHGGKVKLSRYDAHEKACLAQDPISRRAERKRIAGVLRRQVKYYEKEHIDAVVTVLKEIADELEKEEG